jgi:hypothetical protein
MTMTDESTTRLHGGCMCGGVQFSFAGSPLLTAVCHCRQCQRQAGSAFSIIAAVPKADFELRGETKLFISVGDSGRPVERHFCPNCGSPIMSLIEPMPDMVLIKAGTIDTVAALTPTIEVFCESALPFFPAMSGTERYAGSNI